MKIMCEIVTARVRDFSHMQFYNQHVCLEIFKNGMHSDVLLHQVIHKHM